MSQSRHLRTRESLLVQVWKGQWLRKEPMTADDGRKVRIRSPGNENPDSGPDFLDATIILDDEILTGDIELHLRSSDWRAHGHHRDPHFNGVILQVVLWPDSPMPARLESGRIVPTVPLREHLDGSLDDLALRAAQSGSSPLPCAQAREHFGPERIGGILEQAGTERFFVKAAAFQMEMITEDPAEVLYRGLMGALGYVRNKGPFRELARRLPLSVMKAIAVERRPADRKRMLQALLLGGAGLLPSQCAGRVSLSDAALTAEMEAAWRSVGSPSRMQHTDWHFFRMHPRNFPLRRLLGAAELIERHLEKGLLAAAAEATEEACRNARPATIERAFIVRGWIGRGRAREMAINVILPFSFAWAECNESPNLGNRALELYGAYPKSAPNRITRSLEGMLAAGETGPLVQRAVHQQGLIHIHKSFCRTDRCGACPLNPGRAAE